MSEQQQHLPPGREGLQPRVLVEIRGIRETADEHKGRRGLCCHRAAIPSSPDTGQAGVDDAASNDRCGHHRRWHMLECEGLALRPMVQSLQAPLLS